IHREPDEGGGAFVEAVRTRLATLGFRGKAFELRMPDGIKDPADLHAANPNNFRAQMEAAMERSAPLKLSSYSAQPNGHATHQADRAPIGLATTCLASIQPIPVRWLVPGYLPLGKLMLLAGDGGHGKSTLTLDLAANLTTGRPCLGLEYEALPA